MRVDHREGHARSGYKDIFEEGLSWVSRVSSVWVGGLESVRGGHPESLQEWQWQSGSLCQTVIHHHDPHCTLLGKSHVDNRNDVVEWNWIRIKTGVMTVFKNVHGHSLSVNHAAQFDSNVNNGLTARIISICVIMHHTWAYYSIQPHCLWYVHTQPNPCWSGRNWVSILGFPEPKGIAFSTRQMSRMVHLLIDPHYQATELLLYPRNFEYWQSHFELLLCVSQSVRWMCLSHRVCVPELHWLGVRSWMLHSVPRSAFHPLTPRDRSLIQTLQHQIDVDWIEELKAMDSTGLKCDIEALYQISGLDSISEMLKTCLSCHRDGFTRISWITWICYRPRRKPFSRYRPFVFSELRHHD